MENWKMTTIAECSTILGDGLHGTPKYDNAGEYAFINGNNLADGHIVIKTDTKRVVKSEYEKHKKDLTERTVLVSINGTLGNVAVYNGEKVILGKSACYFNVAEHCDVQFMRYVVSSPRFKQYINAVATGTTIKNVSLKQMREYAFPIPELVEQKRIARVLYSLDQKISTNRQINDNLLRQAQLLFQSWFVDYQPFGGQRPNDWTEGVFADIVDFSNGYAFKSKELLDAPLPDCYRVFKQGHIFRGGGFNPDGTKSWYPRCKADGLKKYVLKKGDILMAMTDMKDNVQILGNTAIMEVDDQYIVNQRVGVLRCKKERGISYPYVFLLTNGKEFLLDLRSRANSGVQVNLSSTEIKNSPIYIAPRHVYDEFTNIVLPMFESMISNDIQNQQLAELRDTLLPKLMSGELEVTDIH